MSYTKKSSKTIHLEYNEADSYIYIKYLKASTSEEFRTMWNDALDMAVEWQCQKWLLDQRKQSVLPVDQVWVTNDWFPRSMQRLPTSQENPSYIAIIESENFFIKYSADRFIQENSMPNMTTTIFRSEIEAKVWLNEN